MAEVSNCHQNLPIAYCALLCSVEDCRSNLLMCFLFMIPQEKEREKAKARAKARAVVTTSRHLVAVTVAVTVTETTTTEAREKEKGKGKVRVSCSCNLHAMTKITLMFAQMLSFFNFKVKERAKVVSLLLRNPVQAPTTIHPSVCHQSFRARTNRHLQMFRHQRLKIRLRLRVQTVPLARLILKSASTSVLQPASLNPLVVASLPVLRTGRPTPRLAAKFAAKPAHSRPPRAAVKLAVNRNCVGMANQHQEIRITVPFCAPRMEAFMMGAMLPAPLMAANGH